MKHSVIEQKPAFVVWILFFVSFALKLFYFMALDNPTPYPGDSFYYIHYADNLIEHSVFSKDLSNSPVPDSYWAPGYPFFLAICLKTADLLHIHFYPFVLLAQAVLASATVALTFLVGRFFLPTSYALVGSLFTVFSPHLMTLGGEILSETLLSFLLMTGVYCCLLWLVRKHYLVCGVGAGVVFGLAYLTNPAVLFFPVVVLLRQLRLLRYSNSHFLSGKAIVVFAVLFFSIVAAWMVRDWMNVPANQSATSDRAFENLVIGSHSQYHNMWRENPRDPQNPADIDLQKYKHDHVGFYQAFGERVLSDPLHYMIWYFYQKPLDLWGWKIFVGRGGIFVSAPNSTLYDKSVVISASLTIMKSIHYWLFGLALIGFIFALREKKSLRKESVLVLYIGLISISAIYVALHADARYSVSMRPEMYLCAMYAIHRIVKFIQSRNHQEK